MGSFSKLTAVFAVCAGLFLQVGDKTIPTPAGQQITHDSSDAAALAALENHLAERGKVLDEVLTSLQSMHEMRTLDADRLNDIAEIVEEWTTEKEVKLVALDATVKMAEGRTQTLEERVTELEAIVKELQKTCASCKCAAPTVGQQAPVAPTVGSYGPAVGAVGYGSTGSRPVASSVSYGCTGTSYSVGYGSNGTSYSYQVPTSYSTQWAPPPTYTETVTTTSAPVGGTCYTDANGNTYCTTGTTSAPVPVARQGILKRLFGK